MADITAQPDGGAQITVTQSETAAVKALAEHHLPFISRVKAWFDKDVAPELHEAEAFLKSLAANPPEGSTLTLTASQVQSLRGMLTSHIPDLQAVLAIVESPVVRDLLTLAKSLL